MSSFSQLSINRGGGRPFLGVSITDEEGRNQTHVFLHNIKPQELRDLTDQLQAILDEKGDA